MKVKFALTYKNSEKSEHFIYFDDATYSGNQLKKIVVAISEVKDKNCNMVLSKLHIAIPYMSKLAFEKLKNEPVIIHYHSKIPVVSKEYGQNNGVTCTYFQHKMADFGISVHSCLSGQLLPGEASKAIFPFIPDIKPPYKGNNPLEFEEKTKEDIIQTYRKLSELDTKNIEINLQALLIIRTYIYAQYEKASAQESHEPWIRTYTYQNALNDIRQRLEKECSLVLFKPAQQIDENFFDFVMRKLLVNTPVHILKDVINREEDHSKFTMIVFESFLPGFRVRQEVVSILQVEVLSRKVKPAPPRSESCVTKGNDGYEA
ncbi:MAG: hypothetical protein AAGG80_02950 [Pseudomonadota bacterium]